MKRSRILLTLILSISTLGSQSPSTALLQGLVQKQREEHSAIGWVHAGRLEFVVFSDKPTVHSYPLPGPVLWGASLHGASGQVFGEIRSHGKLTFAAVQDGKILWEDPDLIVQSAPAISPSGKGLVLEGRDRKTGADGLLVAEDRAQTITQVSRNGKNPSWSSEESKFIYEETGEILVYDLQTKEKRRIGLGTSPTWSPDGKWISYRTTENRFVLADAGGKVQRMLLDGKRVLTPLRWSPDSGYLMYVEKTGSSSSLNCPNAKDVVVYRVQDGQQGRIYQVCEGYPFWMLRWVRLPSNVPLA